MLNKINLNISTKYTHIAGNSFGMDIYKEQIEGKYDLNEKLEIWFPEHIEGVSISFVQGLITEMVNSFGKKSVLEFVCLRSKREFLNNRLNENLRF